MTVKNGWIGIVLNYSCLMVGESTGKLVIAGRLIQVAEDLWRLALCTQRQLAAEMRAARSGGAGSCGCLVGGCPWLSG